MISLIILGASIVLQIAAAGMALRLIRTTKWMAAWVLIAIALSLMAIRRSISLYQSLSDVGAPSVSLATELVALVISALMLWGMVLIRPRFKDMQSNAARLREREEIYRTIVDNMQEIFYRSDKDGRLTVLSPSVEKLLGYRQEELLGTDLTELYVDSANRDDFLAQLLANGGQARDYRARLRHKDGHVVTVATNSRFILNAAGEPIGVEGVTRDITERLQTEQFTSRLGRIVENSQNEIYVFDAESLHFTLINRGARENLGYSEAELEKLTPVDIKPDYDRQGFENLLQPLLDGRESTLYFETMHARKDGSRYDVGVRLQYSAAEEPAVFFAIVQDITLKKRTEEALAQTQKMEAIGQLTGGISHDFNNLLTVILGNLELAQDDLGPTAPSRSQLQSAIRAANNASTLTQRLLAFSRKQPLSPEIVDMRSVVSNMDEMLRRTLREDIDVEVIRGARLWACEADPIQLENVLLNLAINSRDAMPDGGKLTIETCNAYLDAEFQQRHPDIAAGQYVMLAVSDTGHGMSADVKSRALTPFFTTKERGQGSGMGLSMVYGFVRQSGGSLDIYSEENEGTTIKIYLPRCQGDVEKADDESVHDAEPQGAGELVLVVEDDTSVRQLTVSLLERLGYITLDVADADAGLELLHATPGVDLLLADVVLSGEMNGAELARQAVQGHPGLRVLYMSGYTENAIIHNGRLDAGVDLLEKPFTRLQLARKIRQVLSESLEEREDA